MANKKGYAQVLIPASVVAIIFLIFRLWVAGMIIDAVEPELEKALDSLGENIVCPPEFSNSQYHICLSAKGDVILDGQTNGTITLYLDSNKGVCTINLGSYDQQKVCILDKMNEANEIYLSGKGFVTSINQIKFISYTGNLAYLKKPIKTGFALWRKVKYIAV